MSDGAPTPSVFTIPPHRSFADSLAAGLIAKYGRDGLDLAQGRILLPNSRAVRSVTDAFVRLSEGGLVLPRLIAIGDPEFEERVGGPLDPIALDEELPPAIDPGDRLLALAGMLQKQGESASEALRLAADLARTLDQLIVEEVAPSQFKEIAADHPELQEHWARSLDRLQAIVEEWPKELERRGAIDLTERRNHLLRSAARRWKEEPLEGFTIAAGITTAAPAIAALQRTIAFMPEGSVVLPNLALPSAMPEEEWEALGPDEYGRGQPSHPQYHLKLLLERMGVARAEVKLWPRKGKSSSPAVRSRAIVHAMTPPTFTAKWQPLDHETKERGLPPHERRLTGVRHAEFADPASEALGIAIALRGALEEPGKTAALVTPDRLLASRVSAHLARWGIEADDSAGRPLSQTPAGTLLLAIASAAAERLAPVALLALLKHPLAGGKGEARRKWLSAVRDLDLALRGPRPPAGLEALDRHFDEKEPADDWQLVRGAIAPLDQLGTKTQSFAALASALREAVTRLAGEVAWKGPDGRLAAETIAQLEAAPDAFSLQADPGEWVAMLKHLLNARPVRPPYGGHPRMFIWGLIEARLQHADLTVLGGLNEASWPAIPTPDPWLAPQVRKVLGLPTLDLRIGLSAHDFSSALGAPRVLLTRARRDATSATVASRFLLRLQAMTGGLPRDIPLERWTAKLDDPADIVPSKRPAPAPPIEDRPKDISVTAVDRLKADPFAFYAQSMLRLRSLDPVDADAGAAWRGSQVHDILEAWMKQDGCDPDKLVARARELVAGEAIHPMLRAMWQPRLMAAIDWIAQEMGTLKAEGRVPATAEIEGATEVGSIRLHGRADRIDKSADGSLAIVDYKTGKPPSRKAVEEGFALQLGLLGLIAREGGFDGLDGLPGAHEYWSLSKEYGKFGSRKAYDDKLGAAAFIDRARAQFIELATKYLSGSEPFTAKLHPAYAPYGDYDQLMRLDEWYGRDE